MKFAAIDIGSNALRLLCANVYPNGNDPPLLRKADLYRVPLRLGDDAFVHGHISDEKCVNFVKSMIAFRNLMDVCGFVDYRACATSALRSADNGPELVQRVLLTTDIRIEIISGAEEAELIALNRLTEGLNGGEYLYIDVGGGSTELTVLSHGVRGASRSFDIGTVRLKEELVPEQRWEEMRLWIRQHIPTSPPLVGIGSGGNINKIYKMIDLPVQSPLSRAQMKRLHDLVSAMSQEERERQLGLRPDRADVIHHAGRIYLSVMKWARIRTLYVPQVGLADGIIHWLYERHVHEHGIPAG
ncbi:MAG: hypothetical protein H7831_05445 [Magnetococcus sp. WYHC-3]